MPPDPRQPTTGESTGRSVAAVRKAGDYSVFEKVLGEAYEANQCTDCGILLMPNHWHLLLWPRNDGELSEVMQWITVTHTQR